MLKVATAFSGGLAACEFALKYEELEHEVVFACEWDKYAREQYLKFHGQPKTFYNDVSDLDAKKYLNEIDLYVWGSPCQDLSLAGQRKGFAGEKSSLFRQGARVMNEMMPKAFIFENVKGLLSSNGGADYKEVVKTFQDMGYLIAMKVVNTKEHGVPQNRERVFIVGFLDADAYHAFNFAESEPLKLVLRDMLEKEVDEKYYLSDKIIETFKNQKCKIQAFHNKDDKYANCITARYHKMGTTDPYIKEDQLNPSYKSQANTIHDTSKIAPTLCAGMHGYAQGYIKEPQLKQIGNIDTKGHNSLWGRVYSPDGLGACLNANGGGAGAKTGLYLISHKGMTWMTPLGYADYLACDMDDAEKKKNIYKKIAGVKVEKKFKVKSATKKGYEVATENDSINLTFPNSKTRRGRVGVGVAQTLDTACNQGVIIGAIRGRNPSNPKSRIAGEPTQQMLEINENGTSNCLTTVQKDNVVVEELRIRRLTPKECFKLQGLKSEDIQLINSDTQSYKIAGNAISVNVMQMILRQLYKPQKPKNSLF